MYDKTRERPKGENMSHVTYFRFAATYVSIVNKIWGLSVSMGVLMVGRYKKRVFLEEKSFHYAN